MLAQKEVLVEHFSLVPTVTLNDPAFEALVAENEHTSIFQAHCQKELTRINKEIKEECDHKVQQGLPPDNLL